MLIPEPITTNYIFITFGTVITYNNKIVKNINPETKIVKQLRNSNYLDFQGNSFKYMFIYDFKLEYFINPTTENVSKSKFISHDQIRLNFQTDLIVGKDKILSPKYISTHPELYSRYSIQYGNTGITLGQYNDYILTGLPEIISKWPVNMANVDYYHPEYLVTDYNYIDLQGNKTIKKSTFGAMKYCGDKVIFWGTGLKEEVV